MTKISEMKTFFLITALLATFSIYAKDEEGFQLDAAGGKVKFLAVGKPSAIKILGEGPSPTGKFQVKANKLSGTFEFELQKLSTGISLRDNHMKEKYLQVTNHPKAVLTLKDVSVPSGSIENQPFKGELELHGEKKEVSGVASIKVVEGKTADVKAEFELKLSDFKIATPEFAGVKVADTVKVNVDTSLKKTNL